MIYYLYQITNKVNGKIYVGVHKTHRLDDEYMGSGKVIKAAILKHGAENFQKEILETFGNAADMFAREKEIVTEEFLARDDVYNLRRGGTGGFDYINSILTSEDRRLFGRMADSSIGSRISAERFKEDPQRQYQLQKARTLSTRFKGKTHSEATRQKMRKTKNQGDENSQFGTFWITDGVSNKKCRGDIPPGWNRGRMAHHQLMTSANIREDHQMIQQPQNIGR